MTPVKVPFLDRITDRIFTYASGCRSGADTDAPVPEST